MGDRIGVDVSFTGRAVAEGLGAGITERVPAWTRLLDESSDAGAVDKRRHRLTESVPISGDLVWTFEHYLLGFLSDESLDLFARIRCTLQFMRLATTGDPTTPTAATLREAMAKGIPIQIAREPATAEMDKTQRAIFFQWLYLCLNPPPYDFHDWPRQEQENERHRRIRTGTRYLKEKGTATIDNRELSVTFPEIAQVQGDIFPHRELTSPVEDFLKAKILGQKFLVQAEAELPLVEAVPKFLLTVPMTLWTAKALAADQGRRRVESVDVRNALRGPSSGGVRRCAQRPATRRPHPRHAPHLGFAHEAGRGLRFHHARDRSGRSSDLRFHPSQGLAACPQPDSRSSASAHTSCS